MPLSRRATTIGYRESNGNPLSGSSDVSRPALLAAVAAAVFALSIASIVIRWIDGSGMPLLSIAGYRMAFACGLLAPAFLATRRRRVLAPRDLGLVAVSGLLLAIHFGAWTQSLGELSVARSVLLVSAHPLFTAAGERVFLGRPVSRRAAAGIGLALAGGAAMLLAGGDASRRSTQGDALALLGAVSLAAYFLLGRRLRARLPLLDYATPLYAVAAVALLAFAAAVGSFELPRSRAVVAGLLALAVFPTILGHFVLSWSIRHLPATSVSTAFLGEPVGASVLALVLLGEVPHPSTALGGAVLLAGVSLVLTDRGAPRG